MLGLNRLCLLIGLVKSKPSVEHIVCSAPDGVTLRLVVDGAPLNQVNRPLNLLLVLFDLLLSVPHAVLHQHEVILQGPFGLNRFS